jgi:homogentisate 1,2-dioxygenase
MPTQVLEVKILDMKDSEDWHGAPLEYYLFHTDKKKTEGDFLTARNVFLRNRHCIISTANVTRNMEDFFRNSGAHEYIFVHHGKGNFLSEYGNFPFVEGDQLIIPRGITFQIQFEDFENNKLLIVESDTAFDIPKHFRNEYGQLTEDAPYCERDIKVPQVLEPIDQTGEFRLVIKKFDKYYEYIMPHHPYDLVGWDGYHYPFAFNIKDYCPKVGRIHLPPPTHLAFKTRHFVVCNFCPRPFDFHEDAIPVPYFHANVDSDEIIYYAEGDFMSRRDIEQGSVTLHPGGITHGPQPGKTEESIGAKGTNEYAVMVDTFEPLQPTVNVKETMDPKYSQSWLTD